MRRFWLGEGKKERQISEYVMSRYGKLDCAPRMAHTDDAFIARDETELSYR